MSDERPGLPIAPSRKAGPKVTTTRRANAPLKSARVDRALPAHLIVAEPSALDPSQRRAAARHLGLSVSAVEHLAQRGLPLLVDGASSAAAARTIADGLDLPVTLEPRDWNPKLLRAGGVAALLGFLALGSALVTGPFGVLAAVPCFVAAFLLFPMSSQSAVGAELRASQDALDGLAASTGESRADAMARRTSELEQRLLQASLNEVAERDLLEALRSILSDLDELEQADAQAAASLASLAADAPERVEVEKRAALIAQTFDRLAGALDAIDGTLGTRSGRAEAGTDLEEVVRNARATGDALDELLHPEAPRRPDRRQPQ